MSNRLLIAALLAACSAAIAQPTPKDKPKDPGAPAAAQPPKGDKPGAPAMPEMTPEQKKMMEMYMAAAQPGKMHEHLAKGVGRWEGVCKMWEDPTKPPNESHCTTVLSPLFEGRFIKNETTGDMMGMPFNGFGINGYDNVSKKFQGFWIDNMGTGMMFGTGELSADGKTMTWTFTYNDPGRPEKPSTMREVEKYTGENSMTLEMYGAGMDGKEMKMMEISYTRKGGGGDAAKPAPKSAK